MTRYLQTGAAQDKVTALHDLGAVRVKRPESLEQILVATGKSEVFICVAENSGFDAAALVEDERDFVKFSRFDEGDRRPKTWLLMDIEVAEKLVGM